MTGVGERYREHVDRIVRAVLTSSGHTDPSMRAAAAARAIDAGGGAADASAASVPDALDPFVGKVVRHAYKVTDADVEALKAAGYLEDAIFEITVSTALGAALGRLECGLRALRGHRP
jgi:alkylhydroperoxidase family enzyme